MSLKRIFIASASALLVVGCSAFKSEQGIFRGKSKDYQRTDTLAPISVPAGMNHRPLESIYVVPDVDARDEFGDEIVLIEYEVPRPEAMNIDKSEQAVKIQKLGEHRWIFLNASTSLVWPRTQNFLSRYGFTVAKSDPASGVIETSDVAFKDEKETKSRFRFHIEKGVHPDTTEVHIVQVKYAVDEEVPSAIQWPEKTQDPARTNAIMDELAGILVKNIGNSAASLLGQNVGGEEKVGFMSRGGEPVMRLRLFEARAKASLAHALSNDGFALWGESAPLGVFYAGFKPEEYHEGFFANLFSGDLPEKSEHSLEKVLQHLAASDDVKNTFSHMSGVDYGSALDDAEGLIFVVSGNEEKGTMDVIVRDVRGQKLPAPEAKQVLRALRTNLI